MENNFLINLVAKLHKSKSKSQISKDAKEIGENIKIPLTGTLDKAKTRTQIKRDLTSINGTINLKGKVNQKGVVTSVQRATQQAQKIANSNKVHLSFDTSKQQLVNQIKILGRNNNKLFNDREMTAKYEQLLNSANVAKSTGELKTLRRELSAFKTELVATNNAGMTWVSKFKESIKRYSSFFSGASMIYALTNQIRNAATEAKTLDDRLVDLQKVTDEIADRDALYKYFDKSLSKAQELNVKVGSLIDAVTEFKKLGWDLDDAELGAKWANILANVGDVDIDTAIGSIKTSIASFDEIGGYTDDQMDKKLEAYTDLINNMSNKYSIDADGLAESIRLSAGTLTEAHMSIEQAATMFATANKYYNDPSYLGNTVKIGSLRMRASSGDTNAIEELQEMGEEVDDLATATSNLREKLMALTGVDIMEDEHTFKSYYDQLYEIAQVMDKLDDTSRANVLETMFGKSRAAAGAALLSGLQTEGVKAYEDAINSAGSATEEYQTWMTSADAACQRFSNTLTETYQSIINGNTVRDLANLGSAVLEFANNWGIVEGTLKGVIALGIGKFLTTGTMALITATKQVEQYGKALQMASKVPNGNLAAKFQSLKSIAQVTSSLTTEQLRNVLATNTLTQADRIRILQMQGMTKEMALQKLAEMNLTQATNQQTAANTASTASTFSLKAAMTGLGATIKSVFLNNRVGIALMGLSLGVSALTSYMSNQNQEAEESRQKAKDAADTASTLSNEISELTGKYLSLSEAVKTDSSSKEELMTVQDELIKKLGAEGENVDSLISKYGSLDEAVKNITLETLGEKENDLLAGVKAAEDELKNVGKDYEHWYSLNNRNLISAKGNDALKAYNTLAEVGLIDKDSSDNWWSVDVTSGDDSTVEGILATYQKLQDAMAKLRESNQFTEEELKNNPVFSQINGRSQELEKYVDAYNDAIENLNKNIAEQQMLMALKGNDLPNSEEEFNAFRDNLIKTAQSSKEFIGSQDDIEDAINSYLSTVPQFADYYNKLTDGITDADEAIAKWNESKNTSPSNSLQKFLDIFNSSEFNESKQKLLDLAASGELTSDTISSTEDYKKLIDKTGMSAGEVVRQIEKLVTATKKLNSTSTGLSGINEIYKQVTDKDKGFADIDKIEGLDDKFKQLDYYEEFSRIVGDGKHTVEEQKQAINKLVSEYLEYTDALDNVNEKNKELYINQLENMGISNARTLVSKQLAVNYVNETKALKGLIETNKAEYIAKLKAQNISDDIAEALVNQKINDDALENSTKRMHSSTHTAEEYAKAHNNLKDLLDEETHTTLADFEKMTTKDQLSLLDEAEASGICRNAVLDLQIAQIKFNNTKISIDDKLKSLSDLAKSYGITNSRAEALIKAQEQINGMNAGGVQVMYTAEQIEEIANQTYDEIKASIDAKFDGIINGSSILNGDGGADYTGDKDDKDKNSSKSNSKQAYDWIEVKLKKLAEATEKLGEAFEKTFTISSTNDKFTEYLNQISEEISANYTAISAYQSKLNSIGLSSDWVQKIQNGEYSIDEIQDNDDLKEKISDYQTYWDKLKSCYDTIDDLEEKRLTAENNYAQKIIEYYDKEIEKTEKLISRREKLASIKESWGSSASSRDLKYQLNMTAQQIEQTQHETDELTRLQQTVLYGTDAWDTYQDKVVSNNESVVELTSSYADLAEQLANLPIDKAEKAIDKLSKKLDLITGRYDVSDSFKVLNKLLNKQTANSKKQLNAYTKAYKSTSSNLQTAWNNAQIAVNSPANRGKKFGEELSTAGLQVNSVGYRAVIQYNTALSKNKDALYNAQKAQLEYTKTVRENTKAQYDNIKSYYAATLSYKESGTNNAQTKVDYKSDANYTLTQDDYKKVLSSKKNELGVSVAERKQYKLKRLEKQYKNGEISREDYLSQLEYINTLDSNIIKLRSDIVSTAQEMANLASTNADKKIEKLDTKDELYDLKSSNAIGYNNKNSFIIKEMANINKRQQIYASAYKENAKNLKSYSRRISSTKATKDNKNILAKVKSYVKGGKKIPVSLMDKVFALGDRTLYANCETYNQFLESTKTSKEVYDKYKEQAKQDKAEKANQKLENIQNYYSNKQSVYSQRQQQLNNRMDIITAKGYNVSSKFYDSLISEESKNNKSLKEERDKLTTSLANSLRNGSIKKYSDEWYEATQKIDDTTNAIDESTKSLIEFENAQRQLKWDNNDFLQERFSNLTSEIDFAIKELGREDLSDDDIGGLTDRGRASASLNLANYLIAQRQAVEYEKEIKELQKDLEKDPYNKNTIERLDEVRKSYEDITSAMQDNKYAIIDLYSQGYDALLNKIKDLISKFTDMLDTEKDAFDYQTNVADKVKEISDLEKQISVYKNVATTEENRANIQKLNKSLADAKKDLQQTQYDKYISDTKDMLSDLEDNMSDSIQDIIKWLSSDEGFKGLIEEIKNNSDVNEYIKSFLEGISYNPSGELREALNGSDISVSTKESIKDIKNWMSKMLEYTEKIADTDTKTAADSVKEKTIKDGKNTLDNDVKDMSDQYNAKKAEKDNASSELSKSRITYEAAKKLFGKDSDVTKLAKKQYSDSKAKYGVLNQETNELKKKFKAMEYLSKNLDVTEESRSKLNDVNKKLYDAYGQRVLDDKQLKELAKILGVKSDDGKSSGNLYKALKDMGINGFAVGSKHMPYDQLALLGEEGAELHFDKSNGILRQVGQGDMVFTSEMAKNLWEMAQTSPIKFNEISLPNLQRPNMSTNTIVEVGDIIIKEANNAETLGRQIREEICKNGKTTTCVAEAVSARQLGKGIGKAKLYR